MTCSSHFACCAELRSAPGDNIRPGSFFLLRPAPLRFPSLPLCCCEAPASAFPARHSALLPALLRAELLPRAHGFIQGGKEEREEGRKKGRKGGRTDGRRRDLIFFFAVIGGRTAILQTCLVSGWFWL